MLGYSDLSPTFRKKNMIASHISQSAIAIAHSFFQKISSTQAIENCFRHGGGVELYAELAAFADISANLQYQAVVNGCMFPDIYLYEVDGEFGEYLAHKVAEQTYDKELAIDHLYSIVENYLQMYEENVPRMGFLKREKKTVTAQQNVDTARKLAQAYQYLASLDVNMPVKSRYDLDAQFASALNTLIDEFEYPNYAEKTVGQLMLHVIEPIKALGFASFDEYLAHHEVLLRSKQTDVVVNPC